MPGVGHAAVALTLPYERALNNGFRFVGGGPRSEVINITYVTPDYFETLRIRCARARAFTDADNAGATPVDRRQPGVRPTALSQDEDPIGRQMAIGGAVRTDVGVVGDVQQKWLRQLRPGRADAGRIRARRAAVERFFTLWCTPGFRRAGSCGSARDRRRASSRRCEQAVRAVDPLLPFAKFRTLTTCAAKRWRRSARRRCCSDRSRRWRCCSPASVSTVSWRAQWPSARASLDRLALGATTRQAVAAAAAPGVALAASECALGARRRALRRDRDAAVWCGACRWPIR